MVRTVDEPRNSDERATCAADQCPVCHDDNSVGGWQECRDCLLARAKTAEAENARLRAEKASLSDHARHLLAERAAAFTRANALAAENKRLRRQIEEAGA